MSYWKRENSGADASDTKRPGFSDFERGELLDIQVTYVSLPRSHLSK